ncbi:N-acetylmuramoyl-L-alanine amidase [Clostridium perfringens]|uniref:N-acetylmuramoyl-L-alanine amidase n=2 Tax=Clostridium perfringens TaxID=1502 RepID=A0A2X2VCX1_CLOPF|nr:N-acetylmuramoyl-L-alanine amidase [Clostridium perfringens]ABG86319.1 putative N-acetylmuramoyl-L-alanine amidase [Clostridium perfringens SM101]EJT5915817.1 N-acetylmuramoyl-L-alanine amidase [Clostridium perfringens]EJT5924807.1 N-acetylmuramoyl-L-alanine amidase [Clostridium perfringens]EJT5940169.1 N-acetylmuramoyl-L-alanine amidase [Clostridium perfringens]EJT6134861.1 N-acetylmuramoyl-L-alanine amidase [Clostridium perfringens]
MKKRFIFLLGIFLLVNSLSITLLEEKVLGKEKEEVTICIDAGHQEKGDRKLEPIAPWSNEKKPRVSSGTAGVGTKNKEYEINLEVAMILKELLNREGYKVVMTREKNQVTLSNRERAEIGNASKADISIKLHCDGSNNSGKRGASILIPSSETKELKGIYEESKKYGEILSETLKDGGVKVNGVFERKDMTGFNWSQRPVIILEMGFMSNWEDDALLGDKLYQQKIADLIVKSLEKYRVEL